MEVTMKREELVERLRDIFFDAAGGISDMANEELKTAMSLIDTYTTQERLDEQSKTHLERHAIPCRCKAHIVYLDPSANPKFYLKEERVKALTTQLKNKGGVKAEPPLNRK